MGLWPQTATSRARMQSNRLQNSYSYESERMRVSGTQAPNHKDDSALIARIRAGDQSAMADLYDRYAGVVYGVALRVLASTAAAEDVVRKFFSSCGATRRLLTRIAEGLRRGWR